MRYHRPFSIVNFKIETNQLNSFIACHVINIYFITLHFLAKNFRDFKHYNASFLQCEIHCQITELQ